MTSLVLVSEPSVASKRWSLRRSPGLPLGRVPRSIYERTFSLVVVPGDRHRARAGLRPWDGGTPPGPASAHLTRLGSRASLAGETQVRGLVTPRDRDDNITGGTVGMQDGLRRGERHPAPVMRTERLGEDVEGGPTSGDSVPCVVPYADARRSDDPLVRLEAHTLALILAVVPAGLATLARITRRLQPEPRLIVRQLDPATPPIEQLWPVYLAEVEPHDPFAARCATHTTDSPMILSRARARAGTPSPFTAHLKRLRATDVAVIHLHVAGAIAATIGLVRGRREAPFSTSDAILLRRLQPLLEEAYGAGRDRVPADGLQASVLAALTAREAEVARLVAAGARNAEIASRLGLSVATVKTHLTRVYAKVGVRSRTQLTILLRARVD